MFSKEMEALIEATLQDGVLTDQEKTVLVKRAQKEGIDVDELDVYIQSLLQKRHQAEAKEAAENDRQSKMGTLKKCPNCGVPVEPGLAKCTACGYAFSGIEANKSAEKLSKQLQIVEKEHKGVSLSEEEAKGKAMSTVITTFPIPNTREDLMEFLFVLKTGFTSGNSYTKNAYRVKIQECIDKIKISFPNDDLFQRQILDIQKMIEEDDKEEKKAGWIIAIGCLVVPFLCVILFIICGFMGCYD